MYFFLNFYLIAKFGRLDTEIKNSENVTAIYLNTNLQFKSLEDFPEYTVLQSWNR